MKQGKLFLVLGVSGVGKTTLINCVLKKIPELKFVPSYTTREPRKNEKAGIDYIFVSQKYFEELIRKDELLEVDQPHGTYYYGIPSEPILEQLKNGISVIRTIAIKGLEQVLKSKVREYILSIFVTPDENFDIEKKLKERDGNVSIERIKQAQYELAYADKCDCKIKSIEGNPEYACAELKKIILNQI
ncbi:guanylate kinase [bacterium AH-315-M05]|nr:guanylate kinase [bacterium AH-315-M05]